MRYLTTTNMIDIQDLRKSLFNISTTELTQWEENVFNQHANLSTVERERLSSLCHYLLHKLCDLAAKQSASFVQYEDSRTLQQDVSKELALSPSFVDRLIQAGQILLRPKSTPKPVKKYHFFRALVHFIGALGFSAIFYGMTWLNFGDYSSALAKLWLMTSVLCVPMGLFAAWAMFTESFPFRSGSELLLQDKPFILYVHSNYNKTTLAIKNGAEDTLPTSLTALVHTFSSRVLAIAKQKHSEPPRNQFAWVSAKDSTTSQDSMVLLMAVADAIVISTDNTPFNQWLSEQALSKIDQKKCILLTQDEAENLPTDKARYIANFLKNTENNFSHSSCMIP